MSFKLPGKTDDPFGDYLKERDMRQSALPPLPGPVDSGRGESVSPSLDGGPGPASPVGPGLDAPVGPSAAAPPPQAPDLGLSFIPSPTQEEQIASAHKAAGMHDPDRVANAAKISSFIGMTPEQVLDSQPLNYLTNRTPDVIDLVTSDPVLAAHAANPRWHALAQDDYQNLTGLSRKIGLLAAAYRRGNYQVDLAKAAWGWAASGAETPPAEVLRLQALMGPELDTNGVLEYIIASGAEQIPNFVEMMKQGAFGAGTGALAGGGMALAGGQLGPQAALPEELLTVPGGALLGAKVGMKGGAFAAAFALEGGLAYLELRQRGIDHDVAQVGAYLVGAANGALEMLGAKFALSVIPGADKVIRSAVVKGVLDALETKVGKRLIARGLARVGLGTAGEVLTEVSQETMNIIAERTSVAYMNEARAAGLRTQTLEEDAARIGEIIKKTAAGMFGIGMTMQSPAIIADTVRLATGGKKVASDTVGAVEQGSADSALRRRSPEAFEEFLRAKLQAESLPTELWVPAQNLRTALMGKDKPLMTEEQFEKALDTLGVSQEAYEDAFEENLPIQIDATRVHRLMDQKDVWASFKDTVSATKVAELEAAISDIDKVYQEIIAEDRALTPEDAAALRSKVEALGLNEKDQDLAVRANTHMIQAVARILGVEPKELLSRIKLGRHQTVEEARSAARGEPKTPRGASQGAPGSTTEAQPTPEVGPALEAAQREENTVQDLLERAREGLGADETNDTIKTLEERLSLAKAERKRLEEKARPRIKMPGEGVKAEKAEAPELKQAVSTRKPSAVKADDDAVEDFLEVGLPALQETPALVEKFAGIIASYSNLQTNNRETAQQKVERFIGQVVDNLLWLYGQVPAEIRERSRKWYEGANKIASDLADRYGMTLRQTAGVLAAMSPQKDWYQNVSVAERLMDIWFTKQDEVLEGEMLDWILAKFNTPKTKGTIEAAKASKGQRMGDIESARVIAAMVRYIDLQNERGYRVVTPEGGFGDYVKTGTGANRQVAWGSLGEIGSAISILRDDSMENISEALGEQHKVRSFYNNIFNPWDPRGHVTIDTHAVAAALLRPLGGNTTEVSQNFGSAGSTALTGTKGLYPVYAEAYRRAAEQVGILPRELQSITWEAARGLFTDTQKRDKILLASAQEIWDNYKKRRRKGGDQDAREEIEKVFGGVNPPTWVESGAGRDVGSGGESYERSVYRDQLDEREGGGGPGGRGTGAGAAVSDREASRPGPPPAGSGARRAERRRVLGRLRAGLHSGTLPTPYRRGDQRNVPGTSLTGTAWVLNREVSEAMARGYTAGPPVFYELENTPESAGHFHRIISKAKKALKFGAAVYVYPAESYQDMRLFVSGDGRTGFAVKSDGDLVSVFSTKGNVAPGILLLAIQNGARKLDAFDTILPDAYGEVGFRVVARMPWNEDYKPTDWNKETFKDFNGGEPDVVLMVYDPNYTEKYKPGEGPYLDDSEAWSEQDRKVAELSPPREAEEAEELFQNEFGFYSPVERAVSQMGFNPSPGQDIANRIKKAKGIKPEELADLGLIEWLEGIEGKVSREQVLDYIRQGGPRFEEHSFEQSDPLRVPPLKEWRKEFFSGDRFYRVDLGPIEARIYIDDRGDETLYFPEVGGVDLTEAEDFDIDSYDLTYADEARDAIEDFIADGQLDYGEGGSAGRTLFTLYTVPGGKNQREVMITIPDNPGRHEAPQAHQYPEADANENRIFHFRLNDRTGANGENILFIEEIQSDWLQALRKEGRAAEALPDAPFKDSWPLLAFKMILKKAVAEGYDSVAWTPGDIQNERYRLSQVLHRIEYRKNPDGTWTVDLYQKDDPSLLFKEHSKSYTEEELEETFGKGIAQQIIDNKGEQRPGQMPKYRNETALIPPTWERGVITQEGMQLGGEAMRAFYDRGLKNAVGKYVKKLDKSAKVTIGKFKEGEAPGRTIYPQAAAIAQGKGPVWMLSITDQMREAIEAEGQPLYQNERQEQYREEQTAKGLTLFGKDGSAYIALFEKGDVSTIIHELAHVARRHLGEAARQGNERAAALIREAEAWAGVENGIWTVAQEEAFAEAFETYVMTGKFPEAATAETRTLFEELKRALLEIYQSVKALGRELDPQITKVFDELFQAGEAMDTAAAEYGLEPLLDRKRAKDLKREQVEKVLRREIRTRRKDWEEEAAESWAELLPVRARALLKDRGGLSPRYLDGFDEDTVAAAKKKLVGVFKKAGAMDIYAAAGDLGVTPQELLEAIAEMPTKAEYIETQVQEKAEAFAAETPPAVAMITDEILDLMAEEVAELTGKPLVKTKKLVSRWKRKVSETKVAKISGEVHALREAVKLGWVEARAAMAVEKREQAAMQREKQRAALAQYREKEKAKQEIAKGVSYFKRILRTKVQAPDNPGGLSWDYIQAIRALLEQYGLVTSSRKPMPGFNLQAFLDRKTMDDGAEFAIDQDIIEGKRSWKELTLDEFRSLRLGIESIYHNGRYGKKRAADDYKETLARVEVETAAAIVKSSKERKTKTDAQISRHVGWLGTLSRNTRDFRAGLLSVETLIRIIDGVDRGPLWQAIFKGVKEAEDNEIRMGLKPFQAISQAFKKLDRAGKFNKDEPAGVSARLPDGSRLSLEQVVMAVLNTGTEANLKALKEGYGWTDEQVAEIYRVLTREEWDFVKLVWREINSLFDEANRAHEKLTGVAMVKEEGREIRTPFGTVQGMYFPLVPDGRFDTEGSRAAQALNDRMKETGGFRRNFIGVNTARGFTRKRRGFGGMPVRLDLSVVDRHISEVAHHTAYGAISRDLKRLLRSNSLISAGIRRAVGQEGYDQFTSWAQEVIAPNRGSRMDGMDSWLGMVRRNVTRVMLGVNIGVGMMQQLSLTQTIYRVGLINTAKGLAHFWRNPWAAISAVNELSPSMATRSVRVDRELTELLNYNAFSAGKLREWTDKANFWLIRMNDSMATYPTWIAAYMDAYEKKHGARPSMDALDNDEDAIHQADLVVRATQPTSALKDLPAIMRKQGAARWWLMFYTFFCRFHQEWNIAMADIKQGRKGGVAGSALAATKALFWMVMVPPIMSYMIKQQDIPDEEEAIRGILGYYFARVPFLRDIMGGVISGYGYQVSPAGEFGGTIARNATKLARMVADGDLDAWDTARALNQMAGVLAGYPSKQVDITGEGIRRIMQEDLEAWEAARGLVFRPRREED